MIGCDQRESGYMRQYAGYESIAEAALGGPNQATACGWLENTVANMNPDNGGVIGGTPKWLANQLAAGNWGEDDYIWSNGFMTGCVSNCSTLGMSPWRMDIAIRSHQLAYDLFSDTSSLGCNNPTFAGTLFSMISSATNFVFSTGRSTVNRGIFYDVNYEAGPLNTDSQNTQPNGPGTVSVSYGGTAVTGVGTSFLTTFSTDPVTGLVNNAIGFRGPQTVYQVSVTDNTHLTISPAYGSKPGEGLWGSVNYTNLSGVQYDYDNAAPTTCGTGLAITCDTTGGMGGLQPPYGDPDLTRFPPYMTYWMALHTTGATRAAWLAKAQEWMNVSYGGPADGPNGVLSCSGLATTYGGCAGIQTDFGTDVFTENNALSQLGKNFGEGCGASDACRIALWANGVLTTNANPQPVSSGHSVSSGESIP